MASTQYNSHVRTIKQDTTALWVILAIIAPLLGYAGYAASYSHAQMQTDQTLAKIDNAPKEGMARE